MVVKTFTSLVIVLISILVFYLRYQTQNVQRQNMHGNIRHRYANGSLIETYEFLKSDEESMKMRVSIYGNSSCAGNAKGSFVDAACTPPYHIHTYQHETFTVISGVMAYYVNNKSEIHYMKTGESVTVQPCIHHTFWSGSQDDLVVTIEVSPGGTSRSFFENLVGITNDAPDDILNLLYTLIHSDIRLADVPKPVHSVLNQIITFLARLSSKKVYYPEYTTNEGHLYRNEY